MFRYMLGDPNRNCFVQCIAAHPQLWPPPSCTVTVNLSASPGRWSLGPLHGPRAQPLPGTRPSMLKAGVASPAPGSSRQQGPAQCAGCECVGFRGLQYGKCCCGLFLLLPAPPRSPFCSCPSGLLVSCDESFSLDTFLGTCPCFACASFLGRMTSLRERAHSCEIQGCWAQPCIVSS